MILMNVSRETLTLPYRMHRYSWDFHRESLWDLMNNYYVSLFTFMLLCSYSQWGQGTAWQGASRQATAGHDMARRGMARLDCSFVFLSSFCECLRPNCKSDGLSFDLSVMSAARSQFWCVVVLFSSRFLWMSAAELQVWWFKLWFFG